MAKTQPGTMERWGNWGSPQHPGVSMVLATVLSIVFFVLEIYTVKSKTNPKKDADANDLVAAAAFSLTAWSFIVMFFGNDWRFTFKLHALITFAVTLTFAILSAQENAEDGTTEKLSIAACVIAWCSVVCLSHVLWCCFANMFIKRWEKKDYTWFATVVSFFLTILSFILWLNSGTTSMTPIMVNWIHGLFIAGTCFALVASLSYFLGIVKDGDLLDLYSGIGFLSLTIFWIAAVAVTPDNDENTVFLTAIIFTAFNTVILAYLAFSVFKKFWGQTWSGRILIFTVILVVVQFTLAMTAGQGNTGAVQTTPAVTKDNWWLGILSAGFSCAVAACFFSTLKLHLPTSLNFNAAALGLYIAYFVTECYNRSSSAAGNYDFNHRKGIAALVLCAAVILLLLISLTLKSLAYKGENKGDEKKAIRVLCRSCCYVEVTDETGVPEAGSATSSSD